MMTLIVVIATSILTNVAQEIDLVAEVCREESSVIKVEKRESK